MVVSSDDEALLAVRVVPTCDDDIQANTINTQSQLFLYCFACNHITNWVSDWKKYIVNNTIQIGEALQIRTGTGGGVKRASR